MIANSHDEVISQQSSPPCNEHRDIYSKIKSDSSLPEKLQGLDLDEDEFIVETRDIQGEFNVLFTIVHAFLESKSVPVSAFVLFLENVPGYGGKSLFEAEVSDLRKATDLTSIFRIVRSRCSWFNHSLLGDIIKAYCEDNKKIKKTHKDYLANLQKYCHHRVHFKNGFGSGGKKDKPLVMIVDRKWEEIRIEELEEVVFNLARILKVPRHTLHLCCVKNGCVQLTILVPSYIPDMVFPLTTEQKAAMAEMGMTELQCGSYHFFCQVFSCISNVHFRKSI